MWVWNDYLLPTLVLDINLMHGSTFPDGYVYTGKNSRYLKTE